MKNVLLINAPLTILFLSATHGGRVHDKRIAEATPSPLPAGSRLLQDLGFLAFTLPQVEMLMPTKAPRGQALTLEQQLANHALHHRRRRIEHVNSSVKRCRILSVPGVSLRLPPWYTRVEVPPMPWRGTGPCPGGPLGGNRDVRHATCRHAGAPRALAGVGRLQGALPGLYRSGLVRPGTGADFSGGHHISWSKMAAAESAGTEYEQGTLRAMQDDFRLAGRRLLQTWPEFPDGVTHALQPMFPRFVGQQIQNSLALRLMVPKGGAACELQWLLFGYADDTPGQTERRLLRSNLIGPAGLVSMDDGVVGSFIQRAIARDPEQIAVLELGGREVERQGSRVSEATVRGSWQAYRTAMPL